MSRSTFTVVVLALCLLVVYCEPVEGFFQFQQQQGPPPRPPPRAKQPDVDYYAVLELDQLREEATEADIKQSFRRLSRRHHPDVAKTDTDRDKYASINRAYEVLSDKRRRKMFHMRGEEGVAQLEELQRSGDPSGRGAGMNPFAQLFGMGGGAGGLRGPDSEVRMEVGLEAFFTGGQVAVNLEKQKVCTACKGSGIEKGSPVETCPQCQGHGVLRRRVQLGPGMVQEIQQPCPHCQGSGQHAKHRCSKCHGQKVVRARVALTVDVERGAPEGHPVLFEMEGEETPDHIPGDLTVHIFSKPHPRFQRRRRAEMDLETTLHITLAEALVGFEKTILHLDEKERVTVQQPAGTVTPYGTVLTIAGKGMPKMNIPSERGDLYVRVIFDLPKTLTSEQKNVIGKLPSE